MFLSSATMAWNSKTSDSWLRHTVYRYDRQVSSFADFIIHGRRWWRSAAKKSTCHSLTQQELKPHTSRYTTIRLYVCSLQQQLHAIYQLYWLIPITIQYNWYNYIVDTNLSTFKWLPGDVLIELRTLAHFATLTKEANIIALLALVFFCHLWAFLSLSHPILVFSLKSLTDIG